MDPTRIHRLENPVRHYDWGSRTAIPELLGRASPAAHPCAELWMGAHPTAPSQVLLPDGALPLDAFIARDPEAVLGRAVAARFGGRLPFLFKVLAAAAPLSIQAHPNLAQARLGFARESREGVASEARSYRDANHKPELLCALTRFEALDRFRPAAKILRAFGELALPALARPVAALRADSSAEGLAAFFRGLMSLSQEAKEAAVARAVAWAEPAAENDPAARWVARLADEHPGDIGVLAPLYLNLVTLAPGEAIYLPAGELHSYLEGVGIELMANSDNVLRGGLTTKRVDVPELLRTLTFASGPVEVLRTSPGASGEWRYAAPAAEFELSVLEVAIGRPFTAAASRGVEILLCTRGEGRIEVGEGQAFARGDCFLVPASAPVYRVEGDATLYRAAPGIAPC